MVQLVEFTEPLDIANRALQHCGARRITSLDTAVDDSVNADEVSFCYDKLRLAEMRRNVWRFSIRNAILRPLDTTTMQVVPTTWDATDTYVLGSLVVLNDQVFYAKEPVAINLSPFNNPDKWERYFGPMIVNLYDETISYFSGELVYTPADDDYEIYLSLENSNDEDPTTTPAYDATEIYRIGDTVVSVAITYQSLTDLNVGNTPASSPTKWQTIPGTQNDVRVGGAWLKLNATTLKSIIFVYPIGAGPASQTELKNVYMLPSGFLREAPQDPKAGSVSFLGAPSARQYNDWNFQDNYFTTTDIDAIPFRFVANIDDVTKMDAMFCEGLACRIALEVCETLTQSTNKLSTIATIYNKMMGEARIVNSIETGAVWPSEDEYISCRI